MTTYALALNGTARAVGISGLPIMVDWWVAASHLASFGRPVVDSGIPGFRIPWLTDWHRLMPHMAAVLGSPQRPTPVFTPWAWADLQARCRAMGAGTTKH